jgi:regulator of sigma E protease
MHSLAGPLGIGVEIQQAADAGWNELLGTMAFISINLGILNLLPIPILDGGMLLFLLIESILRKDVNVQIKERVYQVAFVCLILFAAVIFYNDLARMDIFSHVKP